MSKQRKQTAEQSLDDAVERFGRERGIDELFRMLARLLSAMTYGLGSETSTVTFDAAVVTVTVDHAKVGGKGGDDE